MAKRRLVEEMEFPKLHPAMTEEGRENQLIALATDLVEQRLRNGTASSQETVHFLKLGSQKNKLELEKLRRENELLTAKTEDLRSNIRSEELLREAIKAFGVYTGKEESDDELDLDEHLL